MERSIMIKTYEVIIAITCILTVILFFGTLLFISLGGIDG